MSRLLWIHTNHHSSCKTVSSLYDSVALQIFQLLASFINRAILGCFGNTGLLLHRPQLVLASSTRSPFISETISPRCSSFVWQLWLLLQGGKEKHLLKPRTQDPAPSAAPLCSPWIITTIKAVAAWNKFLLSREVKNRQASSATWVWQVTRKAAPILFQPSDLKQTNKQKIQVLLLTQNIISTNMGVPLSNCQGTVNWKKKNE